MKKFVYLMLSATLTLGLFAGCQKQSNDDEAPTNTADASTNQNQDSEDNNAMTSTTITIEHSMGTVGVPSEVKRVVVFDFGVLDIMDALKIDVDIAAPISSLPAYLNKYESATTAGSIKEPDLEAIFEFEPDLIFIGGRQQDYYDQLSEIAPTIFVQLNGESYIEDFKANVGYVAKVFDKEAEANDAIGAIDELIVEVQGLTALSNDKAMVLLTNDGSISVYGNGSRFGIIHDVLGAKAADENVEVSTHGQSVNYEYISDKNPDLIFVIDRTLVVGGTTTASTILDNDLVNGTNAAINDNIVSLDPDIWYLSGGGITSINQMISDVKNAYSR
jgi:iron complex transport system substrate-binding protein